MMDADMISSYVEEKSGSLYSQVKEDIKNAMISASGYYTAVEVFPTTIAIPLGTVDSVDHIEGKTTIAELFGWNEETKEKQREYCTGLEYKVEVSPDNILSIYMYTTSDKTNTDLVIDWGDGNIENLKENSTKFTLKDNNCYSVNISHTYEDIDCNLKNIVRIFGNKYVCLRFGSSIVSRCFEKDLPVNPCLTNMSSAFKANNRILRVRFGKNANVNNLRNVLSLFSSCKNLQRVEVPENESSNKTEQTTKEWIFDKVYACYAMFLDCENLTYCELPLPAIITKESEGYNQFFKGCKNLSMDIKYLLPTNMIDGRRIYSDTFNGCENLYGHLSSHTEVLWNNRYYERPLTTDFTTNNNCFTNCSLSDQAPISWGGTLSNSIINPSYKELLNSYMNYKDIDDNYFEAYNGNVLVYRNPSTGTNFGMYFPASKINSKEISFDYNLVWEQISAEVKEKSPNTTKQHLRELKLLPQYTTLSGVNSIQGTSIQSLYAPGLETLGNKALVNNYSLTNMKTPNLKNIENNGFNGQRNISSIDSLDSLKDVGNAGFTNTAMTSFVFPNLLSTHDGTFQSNQELKYVDFPALICTEGNEFLNCPKLEVVKIPQIDKIGNHYFANDTNLSVVDFSERTLTTIPQLITVNAFENTNDTYKIIVPDLMYESWIAANQWKEISSHIVKNSER